MCGIGGVIMNNNKSPNFKDLKLMSESMSYRGPDDVGILRKNNFGLIQTRLSIRDLSKCGKCPMVSHDKRFYLVFNGEIYNWRILKSDLRKLGYKFHSECDSEVVLNGYHAWNEKLLDKIEGMYAIAIWDNVEKVLFLSVDRTGEKPIYFHSGKDSFIFGSSPKTLVQCLKDKTIDNLALVNFLSHGYISKSKTIWKEVKRLLPGTYLKKKLGDKNKINTYWDLPKLAPKKVSYQLGVDKVEKLLVNSIEKSLDADVPVGVFLSGGVDSSLITSIASKFDKNIKAYSLGYEEKKFNELEYADLVAKHLSIEQKKIILHQDQVIKSLPHLVEQYGQPFGDASAIPTYFISKLAEKDVKVCLSGDGGDELFGGYWRLQSILYSNLYKNILPFYLRKKVIPKFTNLLGYLGNRLNSLNSLSLNPSYKSYTNTESWFDNLDKVLGYKLNFKTIKDKVSTFRVGEAKSINEYTLTQKILYDDIKIQFPYALLTKVDVSSMAASLEVRAPFLDKSLMEYVWCLPDSTKVRLGVRKKLLKSLAEKYLPKKVIYRKKMGFGIPLKEWFLNDLGEYGREAFRNSLSEDLGYLKKNIFQDTLYKHKSTKKETTRLWLLLWLELWFKQNYGEIN